ncbi:YkvA family protein [Hymenobacter jejuensis]|uniref:DUF1232 domain-containing protein n=1 Tax=Hymenobacter jejuensis TaxID=2502781 RepID=A0A5B8A5A4_9BACT|nr:DUF1232 domain-containing protein [Hymenobacter jejuensis]QDA61775.1 DUF1232 domain-containing protein [Hymenobacter jejuensis]
MSTLAEKGLRIAKNAVFNVFLRRATKLLGKPFAVAVTLREVAAKLDDQDSKKGPIQQTIDMVRTLIRLVGAFVRGSYRQIETTTIISGLAVLLYVLSPVDLVPDFLPVVGFLDDLALMSWFIGKFRDELIRFQKWEKTSALAITGTAPEPARSDRSLPPVAELGHS